MNDDKELWAWLSKQGLTLTVIRRDGGKSTVPLNRANALWAMKQEGR